MKIKPYQVFLFFYFLLFFVFFHFNSINAPFERDEGEYAYAAMLIRDGKIPYKDLYTQKPPLIIYTYFLASLINKQAVWPPRVIATVFTFLSIILVGLIAKKNWGELGRWLAMFLSVPILMFPVLTPFAANTEKFMILPLLIVVYLYIYFFEKDSLLIFFLTGVFSSMAFFYKPICFPILGFIYFLWFFRLKKIKESFGKIFKKFLFLFFGFFLFSFLILSPFVLTKTINYFFESVFLFNFYYLKNLNHPLNFYFYLQKFFYYWWILVPFLVFALFNFKKFWFYFGLLFFSLTTVFSSPIGHYYLQAMPFLILIITGSLINFVEIFFKKIKTILVIFLTILILFFILYPIRQQFYLTPEELIIWVYGRVNPFYDALIVSRRIKKELKENDKIFVVGSEPQIYFYTQKKAPTKFITSYYLQINSPYQKKYQKELIRDLTIDSPKIMIYSKMVLSGPFIEVNSKEVKEYIDKLIKNKYQLIGGFVWDYNSGSYQENLSKQLIEKTSLLVYMKKNEK
ncbi:MAG: glycosyltransferase family 39 protein [Patescibacteria group bacterium]|nr:glycosyltransferase family 39 protein [Patescibacteria group bacterium]